MAVKGSDVITQAQKYLGESGDFVWSYYGLASGTAWCVAYVSYVMNKAGAKKLFYGGSSCFYVPYAQEWLKKNCNHVKMADAKAGDIVIFTWSGKGNNSANGSRDHIGFIRKAGTSGTAYTIEGNTSGGIVANRTRAAKWIYAIYRPGYATETTGTSSSSSNSSSSSSSSSSSKKTYLKTYPKRTMPTLPARGYFKKTDKSEQVKKVQRIMNWYLSAGLAVDGVYGPLTFTAVQKFEKKCGLKQDGLFGKKCLAKAKTVTK